MGLRPKPPASAAPLPPRRAVRALHRLRRRFIQTGLRREPSASACGDPTAPRRCRRGALCAPCTGCAGASFRRGCAANRRRPLAGTPQPRAAAAEARCARLAPAAPALHSDGAAPRTVGVRLRGPHSPAPLPPRRAVRALHRLRRRFIQTGLRREPSASACGDPTAPRRCRRGAPCAPCTGCAGASFRRGCAANRRRPLAGTPQPRAAAAEARRARLAPAAPALHSDGAAPRTVGVRLRGPHSPAPLPPRRAVRSLIQMGLRPKPPASACGDPTAPRRCRRGALCAPCASCAGASFQMGLAANRRRPLAASPPGYRSVGSRPSSGAPVPDEPAKSFVPSGSVTSRPFARRPPSSAW